MNKYKVVYVESNFIKKKNPLAVHNEGKIDSYTLAKELEALLLEESKDGFEVFAITPIASNVDKFGHALSITRGLMVTFKRESA